MKGTDNFTGSAIPILYSFSYAIHFPIPILHLLPDPLPIPIWFDPDHWSMIVICSTLIIHYIIQSHNTCWEYHYHLEIYLKLSYNIFMII